MKVITYNSRILNTQEQKRSTLDRELLAKTRSRSQKIYHWLQNNERPLQIDPTIACNSFLSVYYKLFHQLYINHETKIIHTHYSNIHDSNPNQNDKIRLNSFMQLSINSMHMDTQELKSP